jgi:hypothetical protein
MRLWCCECCCRTEHARAGSDDEAMCCECGAYRTLREPQRERAQCHERKQRALPRRAHPDL